MEKSAVSSVRDLRVAGKRDATVKRKIDFSDIPELSKEQLARMKRVGRPPLGDLPRKAVSIRLDQRVLEWVKKKATSRRQPYQSLINEILEKAMRRENARRS